MSTVTEAELANVPVEVRSVDEPKRIATMLVCRYGETSRLTPRGAERFCPGAFTKSVTSRGPRIAFTTEHTSGTGQIKRGSAVARPVTWDTDDAVELRAVVKFYDTPEGWEAFHRARDGEIDGGSVGFKAVEERKGADGAREVTEAVLHHVMLLCRAQDTPAYDAPRLLEVRHADAQRLLAVKYDPELADSYVSAADIARMIHGEG